MTDDESRPRMDVTRRRVLAATAAAPVAGWLHAGATATAAGSAPANGYGAGGYGAGGYGGGGGTPSPGDVTGDGNVATDPDGDGLYEDVNGDGDATAGDATVLFNAVFEGNAVVMDNPDAFDFSGDGDVTPGDATVLFKNVFGN